MVTPTRHPPTTVASWKEEQQEQSCSWEAGVPAGEGTADVTHQLPLFRWESRRRCQILRGLYADKGVIEPIDFHEVLVLLLVDVLVLRGLVEHGWLRL